MSYTQCNTKRRYLKISLITMYVFNYSLSHVAYHISCAAHGSCRLDAVKFNCLTFGLGHILRQQPVLTFLAKYGAGGGGSAFGPFTDLGKPHYCFLIFLANTFYTGWFDILIDDKSFFANLTYENHDNCSQKTTTTSLRRLRNRSHPLWTPGLVPRCLIKVCPS